MSMDVVEKNKVSQGYVSGRSKVGNVAATDNKVNRNDTNETGKPGENDKELTGSKQAVAQSSMEDAVKRANNRLSKTHCEFAYNNEVNRVSITVIDDTTGKVIREIPPEESLKMLEKMWEITGLMVDEKR